MLFLFVIFDSVVEMDFDYFIKCVELFDLLFGVKLEVVWCFERKLGTIWCPVMERFCLRNLLVLLIIFDSLVEMDFRWELEIYRMGKPNPLCL